jgi:hypothetical protein
MSPRSPRLLPAAFVLLGLMFATGSAASSPAVVLYDQMNNAAPPAGITSQNFDAAFDNFDDFAADDFVVPSGQSWSINGVDVVGNYSSSGGPAASVNVFFYSNSAGNLPLGSIATYASLAYSGGPSFTVTLSPPLTLGTGTYWVSVQANQNFTTSGQWYWDNGTVTSNAGAAFANPGGGWAPACTMWGRKTSCIGGQNGPDQLFRLNGTLGGPTEVAVASLTGRRQADAVVLRWRTGSDALAGFNVWRAASSGRLEKLNRRLIRASTHRYVDRGVRPRVRYLYRLQAVGLDGSVRWVGWLYAQ